MDVSARLSKAKNLNVVRTMLNYVLGLDRKSEVIDSTRRIEWERWNTPTTDVVALIDWWIAHVEASNRRLKQQGQRGRPRRVMGYHFSYNCGFPEEYFQLYRLGIWDFIENVRNQDSRLKDFPGIVAYHFTRDLFHVHMMVNPVAVDGSGSFLRLSFGDVWWKNDYYMAVRDALLEGPMKLAVELGYADPETYSITINNSLDSPDTDKPGVLEYLKRTNASVYDEIRQKRGIAVCS